MPHRDPPRDRPFLPPRMRRAPAETCRPLSYRRYAPPKFTKNRSEESNVSTGSLKACAGSSMGLVRKFKQGAILRINGSRMQIRERCQINFIDQSDIEELGPSGNVIWASDKNKKDAINADQVNS